MTIDPSTIQELLSLDRDSGGRLLSFPAFEIVFDTAGPALRDRMNALLQEWSHHPIPDPIRQKARRVATLKDLNNFRGKYLGFENNEDIAAVFRGMTSIRASAALELDMAPDLESLARLQKGYYDTFLEGRDVSVDLKDTTAQLYLAVCRFEMLEQYFALLHQKSELQKSEPLFLEHFHGIIQTKAGEDALRKVLNGVQVDSF